MVKIQPLEAEPPTKLDFLEYLDSIPDYIFDIHYMFGLSKNYSMGFLYDYLYDDPDLFGWVFGDEFDWFQSKELSMIIFEEIFNGDWRKGEEISKIVITQRFYQVSLNSTQA